MYINYGSFDIFNGIDHDNDYFECDELIAPIISLLNKKGYATEFCCSGHDSREPEILITDNTTEDIARGIQALKAEGAVNISVKFLDNEPNIVIISGYIFYNDKDAYIKFRDYNAVASLEKYGLPDEWIIEDLDIIRYLYELNINPYDTYKDLVNVFSKFYDWLLTIPDMKK